MVVLMQTTIPYLFYSMRRQIIFLVITVFAVICSTAKGATLVADSVPDIVEALTRTGNITIVQPPALQKRLESGNSYDKRDEASRPSAVQSRTVSGYRVEAFADNNVRTAKTKATQRRALIMSRFPSQRVYLTFESPFWRVRVGDFKNRGAADACMAELRHAIPTLASDLRVVKCTINNH